MTYFRHNIFEFIYLFIMIYTSKSFAGIIRRNDSLSIRHNIFESVRLFITIYTSKSQRNDSKKFHFRYNIFESIRLFITIYTSKSNDSKKRFFDELSIRHNISSIFESVRLFITIYISKSQRNDSKKFHFQFFTTFRPTFSNPSVYLPRL